MNTNHKKSIRNEYRYQFQLFIDKNSPVSIRAVQNSRQIFEKYLNGNYLIQIIDVYEQPDLVERENILIVPTLIKQTPLPTIRITGDLSDTRIVMSQMLILENEK